MTIWTKAVTGRKKEDKRNKSLLEWTGFGNSPDAVCETERVVKEDCPEIQVEEEVKQYHLRELVFSFHSGKEMR